MNWNNISLKKKLIFLFLILSITPLIFISIFGYSRSKLALEKQTFNQLTAVRESKGRQIESYFNQIRNQILTFSEDSMIVDFTVDLKEAFYEADEAITDTELSKMESSVRSYYENEYITRLNKNSGTHKSVDEYLPQNPETIALQYQYISNNPNSTGEKHLLSKAKDGSQYSELHDKYHPIIKNYLDKFGYYDIFIVDPDTGYIMYTVFKEVDYSTSLTTGPYKDTNFARAFKKAVDEGKVGKNDFVILEDFEPYDPSYNAAAAFIASPIFDDANKMVGVLVFQMPVDEINKIMTGNQNWQADGLGESGETYLIGDDYKMRSISRFIVEDKEGMLKALEEKNYDNKIIENMNRIGTTIGLMEIKTTASEKALNGESSTEIINDYRGVPVLSSFRKLNIEDVSWGILSEIDAQEAFAPVTKIRNIFIVIAAISAIVVGLLAFFVALSIIKPINRISKEAKQLADTGDLNTRTTVSGSDEIGQLAVSINNMLDNTARPVQELSKRAELIAGGDLTVDINVEAKGDIVKLIDSFKEMVYSLQKLISEISVNASSTSSATQELSASAQEINASMEEVASTIEQVASSSRKTSEASSKAQQFSNETNESAKLGSKSAKEVNEIMDIINNSTRESSEKIKLLEELSHNVGEIIETINSISEQTNLLALNAAIEAASAGEQGRGFTVVAEEVRKLAEESKIATKQVASLINNIENEIKESVGAMEKNVMEVEKGSVAIQRAVQSFEAIPKLVDSVSKSLEDVSSIAEGNAIGTQQVADATHEVTASMEQIANVAVELTNGAENLLELVTKFKVK